MKTNVSVFPSTGRAMLLAVSASLILAANAVADPPGRYRAHCTADQEVASPAVFSRGQGQANFKLSKDGTELHYKLIVANIRNVTASHIHLAPEGVNGPVVAFLYGGPTTSGRTQGVLAEGVITDADLIGPLAGMTLADLVDAIEAGNTYVNVHTTAFPAGEIRGQIR